MTTPHKKAKGPAFEYPKLKDSEIIGCLTQLQIECTADDLKNPTADGTKRIADELVTFMMGYSREELRAAPPQFAAMELMTHPELHEDSTVEATMNKAWLRLLKASGVADASLMDLWQPTASRVRLMFSAVINFARFKMDRLLPFERFATQTRQLVELRQKLEAEHEKLVANIAELQAQRAAEEPVIAQLDRDNLDLQKQLQSLMAVHTATHNEATRLKKEAADLDIKIKEQSQTVIEITKENDKLKSQIVRSPERMKKSIFDMKASVESGKRDIGELDTKARELRTKYQTLESLCEKIEKRVTEMNECNEQRAKSKKLFKDVSDAAGTIQATEQKIIDLQTEAKRAKADTTRVAEKLINLQQNFATKHKQATHGLAQVEAERAQLIREKEKDHKKIEENEQIVLQKKAEMGRMEKSHRDELNQLKDTYQEFCSSLRGYHEKLLEAMG